MAPTHKDYNLIILPIKYPSFCRRIQVTKYNEPTLVLHLRFNLTVIPHPSAPLFPVDRIGQQQALIV
jgi:hypothetical protein